VPPKNALLKFHLNIAKDVSHYCYHSEPKVSHQPCNHKGCKVRFTHSD